MGYLHGLFAIGRGLHEDRHLQRGIADGVGDTALVAEVRQGNDDAVDFIAVFAEEIAAAARLFMSFDGTVLRFFRAQRDYFDSGLLEYAEHFVSAFFGQMVREESTISYN